MIFRNSTFNMNNFLCKSVDGQKKAAIHSVYGWARTWPDLLSFCCYIIVQIPLYCSMVTTHAGNLLGKDWWYSSSCNSNLHNKDDYYYITETLWGSSTVMQSLVFSRYQGGKNFYFLFISDNTFTGRKHSNTRQVKSYWTEDLNRNLIIHRNISTITSSFIGSQLRILTDCLFHRSYHWISHS